MIPKIKLQDFSLLVYKKEIKSDRRTNRQTDRGNNNITELSIDSVGVMNCIRRIQKY